MVNDDGDVLLHSKKYDRMYHFPKNLYFNQIKVNYIYISNIKSF